MKNLNKVLLCTGIANMVETVILKCGKHCKVNLSYCENM